MPAGTIFVSCVYSIFAFRPLFLTASVRIETIDSITNVPESRRGSEWSSLLKVSLVQLGHGVVGLLSAVLLVEVALPRPLEGGNEELIEN